MEILTHLPYPIIYVKAPELAEAVDGFFAWMDYDANVNRSDLRIQWVTKTMDHSMPLVLHVLPGATVADCVNDTVQTMVQNAKAAHPETIGLPQEFVEASAKEVASLALEAMQLILYLAAQNADVEEAPPSPRQPDRRERKENKIVRITDKASEVRAFDVGIRIGAALRLGAARPQGVRSSAGTGSQKRPHARRGHWHHYWTGPLDGERTLILKWTAPTVIHPELEQEDNVVVFPVKK